MLFSYLFFNFSRSQIFNAFRSVILILAKKVVVSFVSLADASGVLPCSHLEPIVVLEVSLDPFVLLQLQSVVE